MHLLNRVKDLRGDLQSSNQTNNYKFIMNYNISNSDNNLLHNLNSFYNKFQAYSCIDRDIKKGLEYLIKEDLHIDDIKSYLKI